MHIPDGFLDAKTWVGLSVFSMGAISLAASKTKQEIGDKQVPLMGVMAAFIFAAQMINFPIAGGTSGHFMGAVLASILLGPFTGLLIMTTLLSIQCFIFQDGGLTALGANIFNMGIAGSFIGYYVYKILNKVLRARKNFNRKMLFSAFVSAWVSIVVASFFCGFELSISGAVPFKVVVPAMVTVHAIIGIMEGLITVTVLSFIFKVRPDLLELKKI